MFFLFILLAFASTRAELLAREVVDFTIEAGNRVGTGMIEFNSPTQTTEPATKPTPTRGYIPCAVTAMCQGNISAIDSHEEISPPLTSPTILQSLPFPLISTTRQSPSSITLGATPTPTPSAPVVSDAIAWRNIPFTCLFILAVMELFIVIF